MTIVANARAALLVALGLTMGACQAPAVPPELVVTSHADGQTVLGERTIEISGTATNASAVTVVRGEDTFVASLVGGAFSAAVELVDNENALVVVAAGPGGETSVAAGLRYPFLSLADFASADVVIGGERFAEDQSVSASSVAGPYSTAATDGGRLFLGDFVTNRVLVYDSIPVADGALADLVLGQASFTDSGPGLSASAFWEVAGVATADGRLYVVDRASNRVLVWSAPPDVEGALYVADFSNGRYLVFRVP